jgi:hypothetical protein
MGRKRLDRKVVTYSIARSTVKRIDELRQEKQERLRLRHTRVTISEILDEAIAYFFTLRIQQIWFKCPECSTINGVILKPKQLLPGRKGMLVCNKCTHQFDPLEAERVDEA